MDGAKKLKDYIYPVMLVIFIFLPVVISFLFEEHKINMWTNILEKILKYFGV